MPLERRGRIPPPPEPKAEPWYKAARYDAEESSERAYFKAQETIFQQECDVSVYRLLLKQLWHVAVLGGAPAEAALQQQLERILYAQGTPTQLPEDLLTVLQERRKQAQNIGPWVQGHYRPGKEVRRRKR